MFSGVKVFTASTFQGRGQLDANITAWLSERRETVEVVDIVVRQSSDRAFHCITFVIFFRQRTLR